MKENTLFTLSLFAFIGSIFAQSPTPAEFTSNFKKYFFISHAQFNSLPKTQNGVHAIIMVKGDNKIEYPIRLFKLL